MKNFILLLSLITITACGGDKDDTPATDAGEIEPPKVAASLKGELVDGYPTVDGGYGYSVLPGQEISWHINAKVSKEGVITINDSLGREVDKFTVKIFPQSMVNDSPAKNGFGYEASFTYKVPPTLRTGVYYLNNNKDFMFVVLPIRSTEVVIVLPTHTMNAYSCAGGEGLYACPSEDGTLGAVAPIPEVSFERPIRSKVKWTWDVLGMMTGFLEWAERDLGAYDVGYITDMELDTNSWFENTKLIYVPGHNEYWTLSAKNNVMNYLDQGNHMVVLGGNIMWWHARIGHNSLVSYKHIEDTQAEEGKETNYLHYIEGQNAVHTLGANFHFGGYHKNLWDSEDSNDNPMRIIADKSPIFANTGIGICDELDFSHNHEFDGVPVVGFTSEGFPVPAYKFINQHKVEILGYTWGYRNGHTIATIHAAQRKPTSGYVVQFASNGAAGFAFKNDTAGLFKQVLENTQKILLEGKSPFSSNYEEKVVAHELRVPFGGNKSDFPYEKCARN